MLYTEPQNSETVDGGRQLWWSPFATTNNCAQGNISYSMLLSMSLIFSKEIFLFTLSHQVFTCISFTLIIYPLSFFLLETKQFCFSQFLLILRCTSPSGRPLKDPSWSLAGLVPVILYVFDAGMYRSSMPDVSHQGWIAREGHLSQLTGSTLLSAAHSAIDCHYHKDSCWNWCR